LGVKGRRYAVWPAAPWPDVAALSAFDGLQAAAPPRAGRLAVAQRNAGSDAVAAKRCAAPDVAPWPVAAARKVDGMPARRDAPSRAVPPDGPWPVVLLAELPGLPLDRVVRLFRVPGRALGRTH